MLAVVQSNAYKRDIKRIRRTHDLSRLKHVVTVLASRQPLDARYKDHPLTGSWKGYRDCHIMPDWVLIYRLDGSELQLARTGSHSELF